MEEIINNIIKFIFFISEFLLMAGNVTCMSSGVVRHGQLQTGTCHWKFRRNFQVGEDKPLLIHILSLQFLKFKDKSERTKERIKVNIHAEALDFVNIVNPLSFLLRFRTVL